MHWSSISALAEQVAGDPLLCLPEGYRLDQLTTAEVPTLIVALRQWYPDIAVGSESCHHRSEFYLSNVQLVETREDRPIFPIVVRKAGEIVSLVHLEKDGDELTIQAKMGVVHPAHRGRGLGYLGPGLLEIMGRGIGAELAYYFTTLRIPQEQIISETLGYQLVGILPASDRQLVGNRVVRVPEAIYAKLLVPQSRCLPVGELCLTPATRRFWNNLFGGQTETPAGAPSVGLDRGLDQ